MSNTYIGSDRVVTRRIRGEVILVPIAGTPEALDAVYVLNETAAFVWENATAGRAPEEIFARLADEFDVDDQVAAADTQRVLDELVALGVLRRGPDQT